jgi:dihydrofolate reductase
MGSLPVLASTAQAAGARHPRIPRSSSALAQSLARLDLIDEHRLVLHPVALGDGLSLFKGLAAPLNLNLVEAETYDSGLTLLVYRPALAKRQIEGG